MMKNTSAEPKEFKKLKTWQKTKQQTDEYKKLLKQDVIDQIKTISLNKLRTKGARNRNNPINQIKKATEVLIVKKANYVDCISCSLCVSDNAYKVYMTDTQQAALTSMDNVKWPVPKIQFDDASAAKKWQILPSKIDDMELVEAVMQEEAPNEEEYATRYASNTIAKPGPLAQSQTGIAPSKTKNFDAFAKPDDDDDLPPPNILKKSNIQYEGGYNDKINNRRSTNQNNQRNTSNTNKGNPFLQDENYFYDYGFTHQEDATNETYGAPQEYKNKQLPAFEIDQPGQMMAPLPNILPYDSASNLQITNENIDVDYVDLRGMANEIDFTNLDKLDKVKKPQTSSDINNRMKELLKSKKKIKQSLYQRNPRILDIEQESVLLQKLCLPSSCRPFEAYAVSNNGTFEFARLEREYHCTFLCFDRPQINVYKSEYKYQSINDHFSELFIGKIEQKWTLLGICLDIYEPLNNEMRLRYKIQSTFPQRIKECLLPRIPCGFLKGTTYTITDQLSQDVIKLGGDDDEMLNAGQEKTPIDNFDRGLLSTEWSHCPKEICSKGTHFRLRFPRTSSVEQKILLISATMMLDMNFYDRKCFSPCLFC